MRTGLPTFAAIAVALVGAPAAQGDPVAIWARGETRRPTEPRGKVEPHEPDRDPESEGATAADVAGAPRPDRASGMIRGEERSPARALLWIPRALLFFPRAALEAAFAPVRGGLWAYETYQLEHRVRDIFFNEDGTVGLYPVAFVETGFGLNAGARFLHRDLVGRSERLKLRASFGGRFRQIYSLHLDSGRRFGERVQLELEAAYEIRPKEQFFGIGNLDEVSRETIEAPLDPREGAVESRFGETIGRAALVFAGRIAPILSARMTGAYLHSTFRADEGEFGAEDSIASLYRTGELVGFDEGLSSLYFEAELRLDTRRAVSRYEALPTPGAGWVVGPFVGVQSGLEDDPSRFVRYGLDVQHYIRLAAGPRVLALRAYLEGVAGDAVPFSQLPRLGGAMLLRGYDQNRFRDRVIALTGVEYQFDLGKYLSGILFVDAGRASRALPDLADDIDTYRVGYGGAIQAHTARSFLARASLASSIDGGLFFTLAFDPIYDPKERVERK